MSLTKKRVTTVLPTGFGKKRYNFSSAFSPFLISGKVSRVCLVNMNILTASINPREKKFAVLFILFYLFLFSLIIFEFVSGCPLSFTCGVPEKDFLQSSFENPK